jgi:hypothetical protein
MRFFLARMNDLYIVGRRARIRKDNSLQKNLVNKEKLSGLQNYPSVMVWKCEIKRIGKRITNSKRYNRKINFNISLIVKRHIK